MTKFLTGATLVAVSLAGLSTAFAQPMPEGPRDRGMPAFEEMDTNGDGSITAEEMTARRAERAASLDANGDGKLSAQELAQNEIAEATARATRHAERMVQRMDADGDGLLSAAELATPAEGPGPEMIDRIDTNDDGAISRDEADAARKAMMERMHRDGDGPRDRGDDRPRHERPAD